MVPIEVSVQTGSRQLWVAVRLHVVFEEGRLMSARVTPLLVAHGAEEARTRAREECRSRGRAWQKHGDFAFIETRVGGRLERDVVCAAPAPVIELPGPLGDEVGVAVSIEVQPPRTTVLNVAAIVPLIGNGYTSGDERDGIMVLRCPLSPELSSRRR